MTRTVEFAVTGEDKIHCAACEVRIGTVLRRVLGVRDAQVSAQTQRIAVKINPAQISPEQVRAKLEELGYGVTPQGDLP